MGAGDIERDLRIKATADAAQAKAELAGVNAEIDKTAASTEVATSATVSHTAAVTEDTAEELRRQAVLDRQAALLRDVGDAQRAAAIAVDAMGAAASTGGKAYAEAIEAAASAVARLEIAQEAVRARGGPIGAAAIAELAAFDAAVQAASASVERTEPGYKNFSANVSLARGNVEGLSRAATGAADHIGIFGRAIQLLAGPIGLFIAAIALIPQALSKWAEWSQVVSNKLATLLAGLTDSRREVDSQGKAIDVLSDQYQRAADATALHERATRAMSAGLIEATDNAKRADAEEIIREAALHRSTTATTAYVNALKEFGIKAFESFSGAQTAATAFLTEYQRASRESSAVARAFAEENSAALERILQRYALLGRDVPPELKKIAEGLGLISKAESELAANQDLQKKTAEKVSDLKEKYAELTKAIADSTKAYQDQSKAIEDNRKKAIEASNAVKVTEIQNLEEQGTKFEGVYKGQANVVSDYRVSVNQHFADIAKARQAEFDREQQVNRDAEKAQTDLTKKYQDESKRQKDALSDTADALKAAEGRLASLTQVINDQSAALSSVRPKLFEAGIAAEDLDGKVGPLATSTSQAADATASLGVRAGIVAGQLAAAGGQVDSLAAKLANLASVAAGAAAAVASVTEGPSNSGGGGGGGF